jgi:hypothetical protein
MLFLSKKGKSGEVPTFIGWYLQNFPAKVKMHLE